MRVLVEPKVSRYLHAFYALSMMSHPSLSEEYVIARIADLEHQVLRLGEYADILHKEPYKDEWKLLGYKEYLYKDFHFAYIVEQTTKGERFTHVYDVVNSRLNYNPEDAIDKEE